MSSIARFDTWQAADGTNVARYNAGTLEVWDGAAWGPAGAVNNIYYLVIGGGGGGFNTNYGGGGGAGGYRSGAILSISGGGASGEAPLEVSGATYTITVGAGGAAYTNGNNSVFGAITSVGGGRGGYNVGTPPGDGGSGGGAEVGVIGLGTANQGFNGGAGAVDSRTSGGGGGGAGEVGQNSANGSTPGAGGRGVASIITGSVVFRAGGGGGSSNAPSSAAGGLGGGGAGNGSSGTANTGGGGGADSGSGGSGVVIFAVPTGTSVSFSGGVTQSSATVGDNDVYTVTATSTTSETVTIG